VDTIPIFDTRNKRPPRVTRMLLVRHRELHLHPRIDRPSPVVKSVAIRQLGRHLPICNMRGIPRAQTSEVVRGENRVHRKSNLMVDLKTLLQ
jgi:hypothetical protein